jgi:hypothetical protein
MSLHIDMEGVSDQQAKKQIESSIRECVGEPPKNEEWNISISRSDGQSVVVVRTPRLALRKLFFSSLWSLSEAIPAWLLQHPVH